MVSALRARLFEVAFAAALLSSIALKGFFPAIFVNLFAIFAPRAISSDDGAVCLIPRRPLVMVSFACSVLLIVATFVINIVVFSSSDFEAKFQSNRQVFHAIGIYSAESEWMFVVFSLAPQCALIGLKVLYDRIFEDAVDTDIDSREKVHVAIVAIWGLGCGVTAVLNPSYLFFPLLVIYTVVIGVCLIGPESSQLVVTWCAKISTGWSAVLLLACGLSQNPSLNISEPDWGIINWKDNADDTSLVASNVVQFVFVYCTCYVSRQLHGGWSADSVTPDWASGDSPLGRIVAAVRRTMSQAIRVAVEFRAAWLLPFFTIICVVGPTAVSLVLLLVVFVGCFTRAPFDEFALPLYIYCSLMSLGVYFGNMFPRAPYLVKVLLANPERDGVLVPLLMQAAVNGLVAVSWVLFKQSERDARAENATEDHYRVLKLKHVKDELKSCADIDLLEKRHRAEWRANLSLGGTTRDVARTQLALMLNSKVPIDENEFAIVWGFLTYNEYERGAQLLRLATPSPPTATSGQGNHTGFQVSPRRRGEGNDGGDGGDAELLSLQEALLSPEADEQQPQGGAHFGRKHSSTICIKPMPLAPPPVSETAAATPAAAPRMDGGEEALTELQYLQMCLTADLHVIQNDSLFHVSRLFAKHFLFANTQNVTYVALFIVGTVRTQLDALHLALLVFFCVFAAFDSIARRFWVPLIVYCQGLATFLFLLTVIEGDAFDAIFGALRPEIRSVVGIVPLRQRWTMLYYVALIFIAAVERSTFLGRAPTLRQWLTARDVQLLMQVPFVERVRVYGALISLLTVLGFRVVFEAHSFFMLGYIVLFLSSCFLITFDQSALYTSLRMVWRVAVVYGGGTLLMLALYQFPQMKDAIDTSMSFNATSASCPSLCPSDIGLVNPTDGNPLTWVLLPAFVTVSLIAILVMQSSTADSIEESAREKPTLFGTLQRILVAVTRVTDVAYDFLLDEMNVVVWVSLFIASVADLGLLSLLYVMMFVLDLRGFAPLLVSAGHICMVYMGRFSFWGYDRNDRAWLQYVGIARNSADLHLQLIGPMTAFLACTVYVNTYALSGQRRAARLLPEATSGARASTRQLPPLWREIASAVSSVPRNFAYEGLLLAHIAGSAISVRRFAGVVHVLIVLVMVKIGRRPITSNLALLRCFLALEMVLLVVTYVFILNMPPPYLTGPEPFMPSADLSPAALYFGFSGPSVDAVMFFVAAVILRFIMARRTEYDDEYSEAESKTGYPTMTAFVTANFDALAACFLDRSADISELLPNTTDLPPTLTVERATVRFFCLVLPPAVLTFVYGAGNLSLINTLLCLGGMLMLAHRSGIIRSPTNAWTKWEHFCNAFQVFVIICNIPPIASKVTASSGVMQPLGIVDTDGTVISFSAFRVFLLWTVYLQRRVFESFFFGTILKESHDEQRNNMLRRQELDRFLQAQEDEDYRAAAERQATRERKLDEIRQARRGEAIEAGQTTIDVPAHLSSPTSRPSEKSPSASPLHKPADAPVLGEEPPPPAEEASPEPIDYFDIIKPEEADTPPDAIPVYEKALIAITVWLAPKTRLTAAEIVVHESVARQFVVVLLAFLSMHTALLCYVSFALNFILSGAALDSVLIISALAYAALVKPWPAPQYWTFCLVYITMSIVVKNSVALQNKTQPFDEDTARWVSMMIYPVAGGASTGTIFVNLFTDFVNFGLVLFHLQRCARDGIYGAGYAAEKNVFENVRNRIGCGIDLYTPCLTLEFMSFFWMIGFYYGISGRQSGSFVDSVQSNLLPGDLVIIMLVSVMLMVLDRVLYISQSARAKLLLHCGLVLLYFIGFIVWLQVPNVNIAPGVIYVCIKTVYLFLSAYQIRHGYPRFRSHDPFKDTPKMPMSIFYIVYRSIPFVWELRCLLDWTFTTTTLKFVYWVKLEDIAHWCYARRVDQASLLPPGTPVPKHMKGLQGGLLFVVLLVLLFFPLGVYSTFNPSLTRNFMTTLSVDASFGSLSTWYSSSVLAQEDLGSIFVKFMNRFHPAVGDVIAGDGVSYQLVQMAPCSVSSWDLSPTAQQAVKSALNATYFNVSTGSTGIDLNILLSRKYWTEKSSPQSAVNFHVPIDWRGAGRLLDFMNGVVESANVTVPMTYVPYILNKPGAVLFMDPIKTPYVQSTCNFNFSLVMDPMLGRISRYSCIQCSPMFFTGNRPQPTWKEWECGNDGRNCDYWTFANKSLLPPPSRNMYFFVMSDMVPTNSGILPNVGIIALYTSFILVIGQVLRGALAGTALQVQMLDMGDPHRIDDLIESIQLCQGSQRQQDLELEGLLYLELIDLLRSSESLLKVTGARSAMYLAKMKAS